MADITHIDDHRPHIESVDPVTGTAIVMPVALIENMAMGRVDLVDDVSVRALFHLLAEEIRGIE